MGEVTQDVKARLSVETDGDATAFQNAAAGVANLASSAAGASPSLSSITEALGRLGESVKGLGPAGEAFQRFSAAIERFGAAKDIDEQRKALDEALSSWKEFGNQVPEILEKSSDAANAYKESLEQLEKAQERLADPIAQSANRASEAFKDLNEGLEDSFSGAEAKLVDARRSLDEYRGDLEKAKAAGDNVTGNQQAELERLEAEYKEATKAIGEYQQAKARVKKDIEEATKANELEGKSINSLGDIAEAASPRLGKLLAVGTGIVGAFTAGYAAGEKLRGGLNALTDGAFDQFIQKGLRMEEVADRIADGIGRIGREANILANQKNVFDNLKLEGFSNDIAANERIIQQHARAVQDDRGRVEEFSKSLGLSRQELDQQSAELVKNIELFKKANPSADSKALAEKLKAPIEDLVDGYKALGVQVPQDLKAIADAWGITTAKVDADAKRHADAVKSLTQAITGTVTRSTAELKEQASVVAEAVASINKAELRPEGLEKARNEVQQLVDAFHAAGERIPETLIAAADKVGVFVAAMERSNASITPFASGADQAANSSVNLTRALDGSVAVIDQVGSSTLQMTQSLETGRRAIEDINPVAGEAGIGLEELKSKYGAAGKGAVDAGKQVTEGNRAVSQSADALAEAGKSASTSADNLDRAGSSAAALSEPLEQAGSATDRLAEGSKALSSNLGGIEKGASGAAGTVRGLATAIDEVATSLDTLGNKNFAGPIVAQLEAIIAKALEAKQALDAVAAEEGEAA